ncbi:hypothetical protein [Streptomyces sp. NPDC004230]
MSAADPIAAEVHRIERVASGLKVDEAAVVNGFEVIGVSPEIADLVVRYQAASRLNKQDELDATRGELAAAGHLHHVEAAPLPTEPRARRRAIAARKW